MSIKECLISDIPEELIGKEWILEIDGKKTPYRSLRIYDAEGKYGVLGVGLTKPGYPSWAFHQVGGGGSISVPYALINGKLFIGVSVEYRHNMGGKVLNVPRGFLEKIKGKAEDYHTAATRELKEETGLSAGELGKKLVSMHRDNSGVNMNSGFFVTVIESEGEHFFALRIGEKFMRQYKDIHSFEEKTGVKTGARQIYRISRRLTKNLDVMEKIYDLFFIPWEEIAELRDGYSMAGTLKVLKLLNCLNI